MVTANEILSELNIKIVGIDIIQESIPLFMQLTEVLRRAADYGSTAKQITISVREPERDGSTMFHMHVEYASGGEIYIGCLRRTPFAETEFHS